MANSWRRVATLMRQCVTADHLPSPSCKALVSSACLQSQHVCTYASVGYSTSERSDNDTGLHRQRRGGYKIEIAIKAFEQRYAHQASATVRDLLFLTLAPKSSTLLPEDTSVHGSPVNLFMPADHQQQRLDWKSSRMSVLRGPHVFKAGQEQFERRKFKTSITAYTHDASEVSWFLDSLKLYQFPGVQLQVLLTSSTFLAPAHLPNPTPFSGSNSLLSQHRQDVAQHLLPTALHAPETHASTSAAQQLRHSLAALRQSLHAGLLEQRAQVGGSRSYQDWHMREKLSSPAVTAPAPAGLLRSAECGASAEDALLRHGSLGAPSPSAAAGISHSAREEGAAGGSTAEPHPPSQITALLAAADGALLDLDLSPLESHSHHPFRIGAVQVGQQVPPQDWIPAVLRAGQVARCLHDAEQEASLRSAYAAYTLLAHSLLFSLFQAWVQASAAGAKPHLALPSQQQVATFMQDSMERRSR